MQRFPNRFCRSAHAYAKVVRTIKEASRNHGGFEVRAKQLAQLLCVSATQPREHNRSIFGPVTIQILAFAEKLPQKVTVCFQQRFHVRGDLAESFEGNYAEQFSRMNKGCTVKIIDAPHASGDLGRSKHPSAAQPA